MTQKKAKKAKTKKPAAKKQVKSKAPASAGHTLASSRVERYYTRIVVGFVSVTAILVGLILYFSFSETTIVVHPETVVQDFVVETTLSDLEGVVVLTDVEGSSVYDDLSSTETREGTAKGTVTLVNNYTSDQPLVESTRLLSDDGVLFRTQETVTVPSGGSVDVAVAADEPGTSGDIGPASFEVVALWDGLKDDIFGTSSVAMSGGLEQITAITATEIENARTALRTELLDQSRSVFELEVPTYEGMPGEPHLLDAYTVVSTLQDDVDAQAGDEVGSITTTQKLTVATPVVHAGRLVSVLQEQLDEQLPEGSIFMTVITLDNIEVELTELADDYTSASLVITVSAETSITESHTLLDRSNLTNRSEQDIREYLSAFDEVSSVDLHFSPFWVTRTPSVADHITLTVE